MSFLVFVHLSLLSCAPTKAMQQGCPEAFHLSVRSNLNINVCLRTPCTMSWYCLPYQSIFSLQAADIRHYSWFYQWFFGQLSGSCKQLLYIFMVGVWYTLGIHQALISHHVVKLFEISYMLVQTTSLSLKVFFRVHWKEKSSMFVSLI